MNDKYLTLFIISLLASLSHSVKIHILSQQTIESNKVNNDDSNKKPSNNSKFSQLCSNIISTYSYLGPHAMDNYIPCQFKYQLLGTLDDEIIKKRPACFDTVNQY